MRKAITLLRNGDQIELGHGPTRRRVRVTGLREKANGTGYILDVIDDLGNRSEHGFMPADPNRHMFDVIDRPDPQRWDGAKCRFYDEREHS